MHLETILGNKKFSIILNNWLDQTIAFFFPLLKTVFSLYSDIGSSYSNRTAQKKFRKLCIIFSQLFSPERFLHVPLNYDM